MNAPWIGHPRQAEFEASFAAHMRAQDACICEHDGGFGEDGQECRRTPARGCPTHREEDEDNDVFDDLLDDALITIEARPLDRDPNDSTRGEKP